MGHHIIQLNLEAPHIDDSAQVLQYLDAGTIVIMAAGKTVDEVDPKGTLPLVPIGWSTDGEYIWPLALEYYLERYSIGFKKEFLQHIRDRDYLAPQPSEDEVEKAREFFRNTKHRH